MTTTKTTRHVSVPNATLWSVRTGSGPPLVLLHGGPGMPDYLAPVAAMVEDVATVHRYDQRGVGRSPGGPPFDVATAVADLDAVRAAWGVERWAVLGHSWGDSLALAYAIGHPERTTGLIYVSGTGIDPAWHATYREARIARLDAGEQGRWHELRTLRHSATGDALRAVEREYAALYAATDVADKARSTDLVAWLHARGLPVNQEVNRVLGEDASRVFESASFAKCVSHLAVPALVIHGALDPRPVRFAESLAARMPRAEVLVLPNVGHVPPFEEPHAFASAVRAFLALSPPMRQSMAEIAHEAPTIDPPMSAATEEQ